VYAINPMAAARYRDRRTVARKKSDHLDALVLANILRTDADVHRPLPADSELVQTVAVLARAQQDAVCDRTQAGNKLTSHLCEYFSGYLAAVGHRRKGIFHPTARVLPAAAPTPQQAAALTRAQLRALVKKAGRKNTIGAEVERLPTALRAPRMRQLPSVEEAMGRQTLALLRQLDVACTSAEDLAAAHHRGVRSTPTLRSSPVSPDSTRSAAPVSCVKIPDGAVANRPIYVALAGTVEGRREILGLWAGGRR
jgi:hypothetical protein